MPGPNSRPNVSEGYEVPLSYWGDKNRLKPSLNIYITSEQPHRYGNIFADQPMFQCFNVSMFRDNSLSWCGCSAALAAYRFLKKNQNAPRPSEHPPVKGGKMSKRLGGIKGCKYKTSSWHSNGFPDGNNIGSTV